MRLSDLPHIDQLAFLNEVRSRLPRAPTAEELRHERRDETEERRDMEAKIAAALAEERGLSG